MTTALPGRILTRTIVGGCCYHLINRGNNRSRVFHEHADYAAFVSLLEEAKQRVKLPILAACLMPNARSGLAHGSNEQLGILA